MVAMTIDQRTAIDDRKLARVEKGIIEIARALNYGSEEAAMVVGDLKKLKTYRAKREAYERLKSWWEVGVRAQIRLDLEEARRCTVM